MLRLILISALLMLITTIIHAGGMVLGLRWIANRIRKGLEKYPLWRRSLVIGVFVFIMFMSTLVEVGVWATTYLVLGTISKFEEALYFSMVTFTTLGYGDVVLVDKWRLLASFEAANGIIMFGWTTALLIESINQISRSLNKINQTND